MEVLPHSAFALLFAVFLLGMRHGLDPDHLATIDGIARLNSIPRPRLARWCGVLFSLGHGVVVTAAAIAISVYAQQWQVPAWLEAVGVVISAAMLIALGALNLRAVARTHVHHVVRPQGLRARWFGRLVSVDHPAQLIGIGALFALSFDTLSQAAMFSVAASALAGWMFAALVGVTFMLGMMSTDALNGLWVARVMQRTNRRAVVLSRAITLTISLASFAIAGWSLAQL